jgi:ribosomal protein S18 acetylase RimI-like enzyme
VCVPDSALPPPFPSSKPYRSYLANVAVAPEARRSGVATAIIRYSERLTKLWGFDEMWLHVNIDNPGARALYEGLGYAIVSEDPWFYLDRRYLMRKTLP